MYSRTVFGSRSGQARRVISIRGPASIVTNLFARVDVDKDGHGTSPIGFGLLARGVGWLAGF
jgi:hypothetical protein